MRNYLDQFILYVGFEGNVLTVHWYSKAQTIVGGTIPKQGLLNCMSEEGEWVFFSDEASEGLPMLQ